MFILRLFFIFFLFFAVFVFGLGAVLWLKLRNYMHNPFTRQNAMQSDMKNGNVIEGEYKVLDDTR